MLIGALAATVGHEPLAVRVGGHVGAVDSHVAAKVGHRVTQAGGHAVDAAGEHVAVHLRIALSDTPYRRPTAR
jgi:hypothetical protein